MHQSVVVTLKGKIFHHEFFLLLKRSFNLWVRILHHFPTQLQVIFKNPKECPKFVPKMSRWAHSHTTPVNPAGRACAASSAPPSSHSTRCAGGLILPQAAAPATCTCSSRRRSQDYTSVSLLIYLTAFLYITIHLFPHSDWSAMSVHVNCRAWPHQLVLPTRVSITLVKEERGRFY